MKFVNQSYYEILDVDPSASDDEVKRAYRLVRTSFEPSSAAIYSLYSPEETEAIGAKIDEAFRILTNRDRRRVYDKYLRHDGELDPTPDDPDEFFDRVHDIHELMPMEEFVRDVEDATAASARGVSSELAAVEESVEVSAEVQLELDAPELDAAPRPDEVTPHPEVPAAGAPVAGTPAAGVPAAAERPQEADSSLERFVDGPEPGDASRAAYPFAASASAIDLASHGDTRDAEIEESTEEVSITSTPRLRAWSREFAARSSGECSPIKLKPLTEETLGAIREAGQLSGRKLRWLREQRGVDLQVISDRTKISIMYLRFIEADHVENLPAPIYLKGFVDQYAQLLQLPREVVERYMNHYTQICG